MVFNIRSINAGTMNAAGRDMYNYVTTGLDVEAILRLLGEVRQDIERAGLSPKNRRDALWQVDQATDELKKTSPDKPKVADRLRRLNDILVSAGAVASAGTSLAGLLAA